VDVYTATIFLGVNEDVLTIFAVEETQASRSDSLNTTRISLARDETTWSSLQNPLPQRGNYRFPRHHLRPNYAKRHGRLNTNPDPHLRQYHLHYHDVSQFLALQYLSESELEVPSVDELLEKYGHLSEADWSNERHQPVYKDLLNQLNCGGFVPPRGAWWSEGIDCLRGIESARCKLGLGVKYDRI
jgi:hypothetical protein